MESIKGFIANNAIAVIGVAIIVGIVIGSLI